MYLMSYIKVVWKDVFWFVQKATPQAYGQKEENRTKLFIDECRETVGLIHLPKYLIIFIIV